MIDDCERSEIRALALASIRGGRLDSAQVLLDGLTALDPHDVWSARHAAEVACARGDGERALLAAEAWMHAAPRDALAARTSARALFLLAHEDEAQTRMMHAARLGDSLAATWARCRR
ncbi:MAG: putative Zn-dependent protease [Polyangiales bacterium]|jgi:predicted Zn-dependent protease